MSAAPDFAALFEATPYPYLLIDCSLAIIAANPAYLRATGRTAEELVGNSIFDAFPANPADPESTNLGEVRASIELAISTRKPHTSALLRYAIPRDTPDGVHFEERYWSAVHSPVFGHDGEVAFVAQNALDVTDLYRFDEKTHRYQLRQSADDLPDPASGSTLIHEAMTRILKDGRNELQRLFDQAPGFIAVLTGRQHEFAMVNEAYYQLVGRRDLIGRPAIEALPELAGQGFKEMLDETFASGRTMVQRDRRAVLQRDPAAPPVEIYIDLVYQPTFGEDGRVTGIFAQGHEVTQAFEAKRALAQKVEELEAARGALRQADRRKDQFLAMLAHELRNPLAPIGAAAALLRMKGLPPESVARTSDVIARQVKHMTGLVDDLLDVSRVSTGLVVLDRVEVDIKQVISDAVEQVRPLLESRRHQLTLQVAFEDAVVIGDYKRLVQVMANLLNNAAKYTPEGGNICVELGATVDSVSLAVADNGIGISAELLPNVFTLFTQAERTPDRSEGGLGLGLSLVKSLVELHGAASP